MNICCLFFKSQIRYRILDKSLDIEYIERIRYKTAIE